MALPFTDVVAVFTPGAVGVVTTRTSPAHDVSKREQILLVFSASEIASGNGVFTVDGSLDNSFWVTGLAFVNTQALTTAGTVGVLSVTLSSTNATYGARVRPGWHYIRVKVAVTTDGRYKATLGTAG